MFHVLVVFFSVYIYRTYDFILRNPSVGNRSVPDINQNAC